MQKEAHKKIFSQFQLHSHPRSLLATKTSTYAKCEAYTKGCWSKNIQGLYKGQKYYIRDLQAIMDYDADSANQIFQEYNGKIRFRYAEHLTDKNVTAKNQVLVQCRHCGKFTPPWKFCSKCEDTHYCSETCEVNVKLTHEKQECRVKMYPKVQHGTLVEVHFGSRLGHNIEVYCQHEMRASALQRGKAILNKMFEHFVGLKNISGILGEDKMRGSRTFNVFEDRLRGYNVNLQTNQKCLEFSFKNDKDYPTGVLKVDAETMGDIKQVYEQNPILDRIELYLAAEGALLIECAEEVHNNHVHYIYLFRIP